MSVTISHLISFGSCIRPHIVENKAFALLIWHRNIRLPHFHVNWQVSSILPFGKEPRVHVLEVSLVASNREDARLKNGVLITIKCRVSISIKQVENQHLKWRFKPCLWDKQQESRSKQEHEQMELLLHQLLNHSENKPIVV